MFRACKYVMGGGVSMERFNIAMFFWLFQDIDSILERSKPVGSSISKTRFTDTAAVAPSADDADFWRCQIVSQTTAAVRVPRHPKPMYVDAPVVPPPAPKVQRSREDVLASIEEYSKKVNSWMDCMHPKQ